MTEKSKKARRLMRKMSKRASEALREEIHAQPAEPPVDPVLTVMGARARQMGQAPSKTLLGDIYGEQAGRAILIGSRNDKEADDLWRLFKRYDGADDQYFRRIIGRSRFPNGARMEILPEPFETRPDDKPDYRSDEEKRDAAVRTWMYWQGRLGHLHSHERSVIVRVARHMTGDLHIGSALTTTGSAFVAAMRVLRIVEDKG